MQLIEKIVAEITPHAGELTLAERADDRPGSLVSCSVSNGTDGVATQDLGLTSPTSLREIREKLG